MRQWLSRHAQNCLGSLGRLAAHPGGTFLTVAVIGIALALPAGLNVLVRNGEALAGGWETVRDFSVYMQPGAELEAARTLAAELEETPGIDSVDIVPADDALEELRDASGFAGVLEGLDENPLPHTLVVRPDAETAPGVLRSLAGELSNRDEIDQVRLDTEWVARLNALLDLARRGIWLAAALLVGAVIVIVGNTIRLDIENQRAEIEVAKLLGATDAFVRRPFLYAGFWYGLSGGLFALVVVAIGLLLLGGPVERLSTLYGGSYRLLGLDPQGGLAVVCGGLLAGLGGAWVAVARHLAAIQPKV
jgi:cell division transport system permease protein